MNKRKTNVVVKVILIVERSNKHSNHMAHAEKILRRTATTLKL